VKLRAGISPCPNDIFIFAGLLLDKVRVPIKFEFVFEDVQTLNRMAQNSQLDLCKISYANAPHCKDYTLLRCGGALGRGCGPLLLTGGNDWNPHGEVLVPGEQTTANFLLDFWTDRPLRKKFVSFDALYRELLNNPKVQGVVIHEMRFTYAKDGLRLIRDLGEHWEQKTGYPIPLGALAYRRRSDMPTAEEIEIAVRESLDWAWANEAEAMALCAKYSQSMDPTVMRLHVDLYVNEFTRDLGETGTKAVEFFLSRL
jgi:1,4-dihydroxy-6-naphthoate synthase